MEIVEIISSAEIRMKCGCGHVFLTLFAESAETNLVRLNLEDTNVILPCCPECGLVHIGKDSNDPADGPPLEGLIFQTKFVCGHADEFKDKLDGVPYILWKADPNEIDEYWRGMCPKFSVETDPRGRYASAEVAAYVLSQEVRKKLGGEEK